MWDAFKKLGINNIEVREYKRMKSEPPMFLLSLYPGEIQNVFQDVIPLDSVSKYAESWLKKVKRDYSASIYVYQNAPEEQIQQLKQEMQKGGIKKEITVKNINQ